MSITCFWYNLTLVTLIANLPELLELKRLKPKSGTLE